MKHKQPLSTEEQLKKLKKRIRLQTIGTLIALVLLGGYLYCNFDYFVLKHLISQNYFNTETLDALYEEELGLHLDGSGYYRYFDELAAAVITKRIREIGGDRYTYLYTPESYAQMKTGDKEEADGSYTEALSDQTAYIKITNFSKYTSRFFHDETAGLAGYDNLIIDLRGNRGGSIDAYHDMADLFLDTGEVIAKDVARLPFFTQEIISKTPAVFHFQKVVILQDQNTASSSEGFIAALKDQLDTVTLIGETTFGKGIGQITIPLTKGYAVKATVFWWLSPKGYTIHQQGIAPDIPYPTDTDDIIPFAQGFCENGAQ